MLDPQQLIERTCAGLIRFAGKAQSKDSELISVTLSLPALDLSPARSTQHPFFFWSRPENDHSLLGVGITRQVVTPSMFEANREERGADQRLLASGAAFERLRRSWRRIDEENTGHEPVAFAAFAYDPEDPMDGPWRGMPNCGIFVPTVLLQRRNGRCSVTFTGEADAPAYHHSRQWRSLLHQLLSSILRQGAVSSDRPAGLAREYAQPEDRQWLDLVAQATRDIGRGRMEKVVPVRRVRLRAAGGVTPDPADVVRVLGETYPNCALLAVHLDGPTLIAATPERLITVKDGQVISDAVGGTIRRAADDAEDRELAEELLDSVKARHEHALVVNFIAEALRPLCDELSVPAVPNIVKLRNLQHLWTPLRGRIKPFVSLLEAAAHLHPTPAVGGLPSGAARQWLKRNESLQRGWYTGAMGWLGVSGEGELSVLLRCALLHEDAADLFAGAGVVADSQPEAELEETELKLHAVLDALASSRKREQAGRNG